MGRWKCSFAIVFVGSILLNSCAILQKGSDTNVENITLSDKSKFDFTYSFFEANKYQLKGKFDLAIGFYNECLKLDNTSAAVYYNLAKIYYQTGDYNAAEFNILKAITFNNANNEYLWLASNVLQKNEKLDQAIDIVKQLINRDPKNFDYYIGLSDLQLQAKRIKEAIKTYDKIDHIFGISEMIILQKNKIYISLNKIEDARNELVKLSNYNKSSIDYKRMIADFDVQFNELDRAIVQYNSILKIEPNDGYSHIGLAECYQQKGMYNEAFSQIKLSFNSNDVPSDVKISLFLTIWQNTSTNDSLKSYLFDLTKILVNKYPENADVNTIYADFLLRDNKLVEAKEVIRKILEKRKDKFMLWEQLILIENQFADWQSMLKETSEALKYFPNQGFLYFFKGFSAFQLEKFVVSHRAFDFGFKIITKDDPLYKDFVSFLAETNHRIGNKKEAFEYFDLLLSLDNENIMALNNYAYYLSEENSNLDKAKNMSFKTIEKEPENSTYLDTYAWILFKMNNYSEALVYIEKAFNNNTDSSAVIVEHYGDIVYHTGDVDKANELWKLAKTYGEGSEFLDAKIEKEIFID